LGQNLQKKYLYLSNKSYDGTVYQTQIIDWLNLYRDNNINFELIQFLHPKELRSVKNIINQQKKIKSKYPSFKGYLLQFPNTRYFHLLNSLLILYKILPYLIKGYKIILFGRVLIGNEIKILRSLLPDRINFIFDARAASAEEIKYVAIKNSKFNKEKNKLYKRVQELEYSTIQNSIKTFAVSEKLIQYFIENYRFSEDKFLLYPCLSDSSKFYFDQKIRDYYRIKLNISDNQRLILYAGGFISEWHITHKMFKYFEEISSIAENLKFIVLTNEIDYARNLIQKYHIKSSLISVLNVSNEDVIFYLNAADFGVLFRDNTPMNNVASPSKFTEYMLAGLPVLISKGVGDFTNYVSNNNTGIVIDLEDITKEQVNKLLSTKFNRFQNSLNAKSIFAKQTYIKKIITEFELC